jgi:ElaB/YqjD/DUF883 family membrane-anchored ribosome-binding protein
MRRSGRKALPRKSKGQQARASAADVADSATDAVTKTAGSFERVLRRTIEEQPYTAVLIGIGIGWLLGRSHRPF